MPVSLIQPIIPGNACVSGQNQGTRAGLGGMAFTLPRPVHFHRQDVKGGPLEIPQPLKLTSLSALRPQALTSNGLFSLLTFIARRAAPPSSHPASQDTPHPSHSNSQKAGHFPFRSPSPTLPQLSKSFPVLSGTRGSLSAPSPMLSTSFLNVLFTFLL